VNASTSVAPASSEPTSTPTSTFDQFELSPATRAALRTVGYVSPTPIQAATIATALQGRDLIGAAQTGTGKTAAFMIPLVERLRNGAQGGTNGSAVILAPTRELAEQIHGWAQRLGAGLKTALVVGGVPYGPQMGALRARPAIIIATPGRLVDHLERKTLALADVRIFVLDEADRMLDMGFKPQLDKIMRMLPTERQTLLFSATMPPDLGALARMHLKNPARVAVGAQAVPPSKATQDVYLVSSSDKTKLLLTMVATNPGNVLVFARTKHRTDRVMRSLCDAGFSAQRLHSNRSMQQRREALEGFRRGRYRVLVATDIAARGIDVADIRHVINYDLPMTVEDYVHRVGRTARADADGRATSFASPEERGQLKAIERHIGRALPRSASPDHSARPAASAPVPHRAPRPVDSNGPAHRRTVRPAVSLADFGAEGGERRRRPSAQARRTRRGRHS
jgi:ATP-dependent RNA helicase RhlE